MIFSDTATIKRQGFEGFIPIRELKRDVSVIPNETGVYLVLNMKLGKPEFIRKGTGGFFKNKDPNVPIAILEENWVEDSPVIYIGKAGGNSNNATLRSRINQYVRFGQGYQVGHRGGRYIWQLKDANDLKVCWRVIKNIEPEEKEFELLTLFRQQFGKLPFANLKLPNSGKRNPKETYENEWSDNLPKLRPMNRNNSVNAINNFIQQELKRRNFSYVSAVEAAKWLNREGLLKDSESRPGKPLRDLLRAGKIDGQKQQSNRRWYIYRIK